MIPRDVASTLTCVDWRHLSEQRVQPLYAAEVRWWASRLEWHSADSWSEVERGRQLGTVPGFAVTGEEGAIIGWSYYLVEKRAMRIGAFIAATDASAQLMLDAILNEATLESVECITFFAHDNPFGLAFALKKCGLTVDRYSYLGKSLDSPSQPFLADVRRWRMEDREATAELFSSAYGDADEARPFAPHGTSDEWQEYVSQLTSATGCGSLLPHASICIPSGADRLMAVALVTRIAPTTGHVVQLAVDPQIHGRKVGARSLDAACSAAFNSGCARVTLFVGGRNTRARRLYETAGFKPMESFLAAGAFLPR